MIILVKSDLGDNCNYMILNYLYDKINKNLTGIIKSHDNEKNRLSIPLKDAQLNWKEISWSFMKFKREKRKKYLIEEGKCWSCSTGGA